jgi:putative ABC transport system permease protein
MLFEELRHALRSLVQQPAFVMTCVLTLALGIGANTAMFSVVNTVILKPLPYPDSDGLVAVWSSPVGGRERWTSAYLDFAEWNSAGVFERMAVYNPARTTFRGTGAPIQLVGTIASADLFSVLQVQPEIGRGFSAEDDQPGGAQVVVLSHEAWERHFNSNTEVVGRQVAIGDRGATVIGVMPRGFKFPATRSQVDYYMPLTPVVGEQTQHRSDMFLRCVARLRSGETIPQAQSELSTVAGRLASTYPNTNSNRAAWVNPLAEDLVGKTRPTLLLLFGSVGFVLLIACANVANLLLARSTARRREIAVRAALGASRRRIVAQVFCESALLAVLGGLIGLLLAKWILYVMIKLQSGIVPLVSDTTLDWRVLLFTFATAVMVTLVAGIVPALVGSRVVLTDVLNDGGRGSSLGRHVRWTRSALVVSQVSLLVMLLIGGGLLVRSLAELRKVEPGFNPQNVFTVTLAPGNSKFKTADERNLYFDRVLKHLAETPGVEATACIAPIPFGLSESDTEFTIVGRPPFEPGQEPLADYRIASPDYFRVMQIPLLRGRDFSVQDRTQAPQVVIINESFAKRFFPGEDPLAHSLILGADPIDNPNPPPRQIVGVVRDAYHSSLEQPPGPEFYVPMLQEKSPSMDFVVREKPGYAGTVVANMREAMRGVDGDEYVAEPRPLTALLDQSITKHKFTVALLGVFAIEALLLAMVGIYAVMSRGVAQRTHEIGIRLALGAQVADVRSLVIKQGMSMAVMGVAIGLAGAFALTRTIQGLLFGVMPTDVTTFLAVSGIVMLVGLIACYVPARRATKVDPLVALKYE